MPKDTRLPPYQTRAERLAHTGENKEPLPANDPREPRPDDLFDPDNGSFVNSTSGDQYFDRRRQTYSEKYLAPKGLQSPPPPPLPKCYESHPAYAVSDELLIYGGSGVTPSVNNADVYVSFEEYRRPSIKGYPWEPGEDFTYPIRNMAAPADAQSFVQLIDWLALQLYAGKKVHLGCIGGHGRTGLVLAALRYYLTQDPDAIAHVRANYCAKAVESPEQVDFLVKYWHQNPAKARHSYSDKPEKKKDATHHGKPHRKPGPRKRPDREPERENDR